jgi:hypothetical protein
LNLWVRPISPRAEGFQIFVRNAANPDSNKPEDTVNVNVMQVNGNEPKRYVFNKVWAWEDTPAEMARGRLPP